MLPSAAVYRLPWEITSAQEGDSVRTFGKLIHYEPEESKATLSAHHASKDHNVVVNTVFVEPFDAITGAQYIVLGELESVDNVVILKARVLTCIEGVNIALLQKAITEQRSFLNQKDNTE